MFEDSVQDEVEETDEPISGDPYLEAQWNEWSGKARKWQIVDTEKLRQRLIDELTFMSAMSVEEYTLYQKWVEIQGKYPTKVQTSFDTMGDQKVLESPEQARMVAFCKSNIWIPSAPDDYLKLQPELVYTDDSGDVQELSTFGESVTRTKQRTKELPELWNTVRTFSSTMKNNNNIGRNMNFIARDKPTGKYLGVVCISSDFLDLTPRDQFVGWTQGIRTLGFDVIGEDGKGMSLKKLKGVIADKKAADPTFTTKGMIDHTAIGSSIVPLQPLGYNYTGGKLLALLCLSDTVQETWKRIYGDVLAAVTTTSLYGSFSQYQNLQYWKKRGHSSGSVSYLPNPDTVYMCRDWLKVNYTRKYFEWYEAKKSTGQPYKRDHRNRSMTFVYNKLNIPKNLIRSEHQRGIYFAPLYTNSCEFLRKEIDETKLVKAFDTSTEALVQVWKDRYASKRIASLVEKGQVSTESLFYDDLIYLTWEEAKAKYLPQVGR